MPLGFLHVIGKEKSVQANLVCVQMHILSDKSDAKLGMEEAWPLWFDCTEAGRYGNDRERAGFNYGRYTEGFILLIYLNLSHVLITKTSHTLCKIQKRLGHRSLVLEIGSYALPNFTYTQEHILQHG